MKNNNPIEYEEGSGNEFADLGLDDADELFARSQIRFHVYQIIKDRGLKQREAAELLGIAQPDVSLLMNGRALFNVRGQHYSPPGSRVFPTPFSAISGCKLRGFGFGIQRVY